MVRVPMRYHGHSLSHRSMPFGAPVDVATFVPTDISSLQAWWAHDDGSGTTLTDSVGGNDMVISVDDIDDYWAPTAPDGSQVARYEGAVSDRANGGNICEATDNVFSIAACCYADLSKSYKYHTIISKYEDVTADPHYQMFLDSTSWGVGTHRWYIRFKTNAGQCLFWSDDDITSTGWYMLTWQMSLTQAENRITANNSVVEGTWWMWNTGTSLVGGDGDCLIGNSDEATPTSWFYGELGDILWFNARITDANVSSLYTYFQSKYSI